MLIRYDYLHFVEVYLANDSCPKVSKKPTYFSLAWKQIWNGNEGRLDYEPFDENQTAKLASAKYGIVSTFGFLITWKGIEIAEHLAEEQKKRERVNDHDWSGSGVSEVMLNMVSPNFINPCAGVDFAKSDIDFSYS